ncbi:MAG: hypothetical protein PHF18_17740 [Methanosarcina sp.]|nr:hypothetical protein [Methanosarcina sp.]MDD3248674.1 hypothetical protein [Methanosarcina sp.]
MNWLISVEYLSASCGAGNFSGGWRLLRDNFYFLAVGGCSEELTRNCLR